MSMLKILGGRCRSRNAGFTPEKSASDHIKNTIGGRHGHSGWIDKTWYLLAIKCLLKVIMKKCILHVELVYQSCSGCSNAENNLSGRQLHDWAEYLVVVNTVLLREAKLL